MDEYFIMVIAKYLIWANEIFLGHVTGINSATTTCQPRPANHDLCVSLAFELIRKRSLMPQYASKWRDYKVFDMETHILLTF